MGGGGGGGEWHKVLYTGSLSILETIKVFCYAFREESVL